MTKTNNIIIINDKHYDAITGKPVSASVKPAKHHVKNIDGFVRSSAPAPQPTKVKSAHTHATSVTKPSAPKARAAAQHAPVHKTHPSTTLMRQAVAKPNQRLHISGLRALTPTDVLAPSTASVAVMPKLSYATVDTRRQGRAKKVKRSKLVSRFGEGGFASEVSAVAPATPVASLSAAPMPSVLQPLTHHKLPRQHSMDIFERAIAKANSHEQTPPSRKAHATVRRKSRSRRLANVSTAALAVVVLGGFLAYQNIANVTVRMASAKAGFTASLPGYKPAGFSVGKFAYSPGNVTINFHSNSDDRHFALTEQPSSWDSNALLNDFVATKTNDYQTVQTAGRTLYIYGKNNATWVNAGVWYQVNTDNSLSTSQLATLASSM